MRSTRPSAGQILFEVSTPLGFNVEVTRSYWRKITTIKHPIMAGREADVERALKAPQEIRRSRSDPAVYLFYGAKEAHLWVCAVAKRLNGNGFLITTYRTRVIKEGERVWPK